MKYKIGHINNNTGTKGWICGHFFPKESLLHTSELEVKFDTLKPGDTNEEHRHSEGTEVIVIIKGKIEFKLNGKNKNFK